MEETVKTNSFGSRNKLLQIDEAYIRFNQQAIRIADVTGIMYWVSPMVLYRFALGWKYHIGFRTPHEQLDIVFRSFFGISDDYFKGLCESILNKVWAPVTDRLLEESLETIKAGKPLDYGYCQLSEAGIYIPEKQLAIPWNDLLYEKKYDRLVLNSRSDHTIWTNFEFEEYWNIDVLIALLDWLYMANGLSKLPHPDSA